MVERKDISGVLIMRDDNGMIMMQIVSDKSDNMSVVSIDAFNVDIAGMIDSLMPALDVENSLADAALATINYADAQDKAE